MPSLIRSLIFILLCPSILAQQIAQPKSVYVPAHSILQHPPHDTASSSLIMEPMPLVAPLFIEDHHTSSVLVLVNNSPANAGATISIRTLQGAEIGHIHIVLKPHEDRKLQLSSLVPNTAKYGSISLVQDSELQGPAIAAQVLITDNWNTTPAYLDEELAMPDMMHGSSILRAVTDETVGAPLVAITNLAPAAQIVTIRCLTSDQKQTEATFTLVPSATSLTSACSTTPVSGVGEILSPETDRKSKGVVGIEISGDSGPGALAAFAIAPHVRNTDIVFSSVPFNDPALIHSPNFIFAGVPIGPQPTLPNGLYIPRISLSNFSTEPAHVTVTLNSTVRSRLVSSDNTSSIAAPQIISSITIPPHQTSEIVFAGKESQSGLLNSIYVATDRQSGEVQGKLVSRSDGSLYEIELLGKDAKDMNNGGNHPWTSEGDAESHLILYNHSKTVKKFDVAVSNGQVLWDKTYYLDPFETLEISFNQLMRDKMRDDKHQMLDPTLAHGVVNWMTPDSGDSTGRLMVTSRTSMMARNYSCGNFIFVCGGNFTRLIT